MSVLQARSMSSHDEINSSDDEIHSSGVKENHANTKFVQLLKNHKVLFNKSQVPKIKEAKEKAIKELERDYMKIFGKVITSKQLKKKDSKYEERIKKKATGNRKIILKEWETFFLELMDKGDNPVFNKIPGAQKIGITTDDINRNAIEKFPEPVPPKRVKIKVQFTEADETSRLSTTQLQRLVLLEQLKLTRMQIQKEQIVLERLQEQKNELENSEILSTDDGLTFIQLK